MLAEDAATVRSTRRAAFVQARSALAGRAVSSKQPQRRSCFERSDIDHRALSIETHGTDSRIRNCLATVTALSSPGGLSGSSLASRTGV